jgi:hypothetical protein
VLRLDVWLLLTRTPTREAMLAPTVGASVCLHLPTGRVMAPSASTGQSPTPSPHTRGTMDYEVPRLDVWLLLTRTPHARDHACPHSRASASLQLPTGRDMCVSGQCRKRSRVGPPWHVASQVGCASVHTAKSRRRPVTTRPLSGLHPDDLQPAGAMVRHMPAVALQHQRKAIASVPAIRPG